jgi:hypothetical protein
MRIADQNLYSSSNQCNSFRFGICIKVKKNNKEIYKIKIIESVIMNWMHYYTFFIKLIKLIIFSWKIEAP